MKKNDKVFIFAIFFFLATGFGLYYALAFSDIKLSDFMIIWNFSKLTILLLVMASFLTFFAEVIRYIAFAKLIGVNLGWKAAQDTMLVQFFFSWISPAGMLGVPAAAGVLKYHSVPWNESFIIAYTKSVTGIVFLFVSSFFLLVLGFGPPPNIIVMSGLTYGFLLVLLLLFPLIQGVFFPLSSKSILDKWAIYFKRKSEVRKFWFYELFVKAILALEKSISILSNLSRDKFKKFLIIALVQIFYFSSFALPALILCRALYPVDLLKSFGTTLSYIGLSVIAPTPSGAGLAEASTQLFYGELLPAKDAVIVVILFRALTFYTQIILGFLRVITMKFSFLKNEG